MQKSRCNDIFRDKDNQSDGAEDPAERFLRPESERRTDARFTLNQTGSPKTGMSCRSPGVLQITPSIIIAGSFTNKIASIDDSAQPQPPNYRDGRTERETNTGEPTTRANTAQFGSRDTTNLWLVAEV